MSADRRWAGGLLAVALWCLTASCSPVADERPPNVILMLADDLGFADIGPFGGDPADTPNLDRLAAEGMRLTRFYMPASACTPSRAALMTGRYPLSVGLPNVLGPRSTIGLDSSLVTIAEVFRAAGYATAAVGKWHLGDHPDFLPTRHGFDRWFGLPYSNDMSPDPANNPRERARRHPPLPLIRDTTVVEREPDQRLLTGRYVDEAVTFIRETGDRPFFLYFAHSDPHVPLYPGPRFAGTSARGTFGDVVREIDASIDAIRRALEATGNADRTLLLFTSDNGPWLVMGNHAGSAGELREGKATAFDGGHRVPALAWWPGHVPAGSESRSFLSALDVLPTAAALAGIPLPDRVRSDGRDRSAALLGLDDGSTGGDPFLFYRAGRLHAIRAGRWKLHLEHTYASMDGGTPGRDGIPGSTVQRSIGPALFDLVDDPGERIDRSGRHPDIVDSLTVLADSVRKRYGDRARDVVGSMTVGPGRVPAAWSQQSPTEVPTGEIGS